MKRNHPRNRRKYNTSFKPKNLTKKQEEYWDVLLFLLKLIILSAPLYIMLAIPGILGFMQQITANTTAQILRLIGIYATQEASTITIVDPNSPFRFIISEDCTGWKSMIFLFALIFAVRGFDIKKRTIGVVVGSMIIFIANMGRIIGTVLIERLYGMNIAVMFHDWVFRYGLVAIVLLIWASWIYLSRKPKNKKG